MCFSCSTESTSIEQTKPFFDLKAFFSNEIMKLKTIKKVKKVISFNGKVEENNFDILNYKEELSVFINSDINKNAWIDKYTIDSTFNAQKELNKLQYSANKESLKTQKIEINFLNKQPSEIIITNISSNPIAIANQVLRYTPNKGYRIDNTQQQILSEEKTMRIEVFFE